MQSLSAKRTFFYTLLIAFVSLTISCNKDHDLISEYMVSDTTASSLEQKTTTKLLSDAQKLKQEKQNDGSTEAIAQ